MQAYAILNVYIYSYLKTCVTGHLLKQTLSFSTILFIYLFIFDTIRWWNSLLGEGQSSTQAELWSTHVLAVISFFPSHFLTPPFFFFFRIIRKERIKMVSWSFFHFTYGERRRQSLTSWAAEHQKPIFVVAPWSSVLGEPWSAGTPRVVCHPTTAAWRPTVKIRSSVPWGQRTWQTSR